MKNVALFLLAVVSLVFGSGCGLLSAVANPKVAWAINDPAPMSVVVRRADAAEKTAAEVDRLLAQTPADENADWTKKLAPEQADAQQMADEIAQHPLYQSSHARVVAAEVWTKALTSIKGPGATSSAPANATNPPPPEAPVAAPPPPAVEPVVAQNGSKRGGKGKKERDKGDKGAAQAKADAAASAAASTQASAVTAEVAGGVIIDPTAPPPKSAAAASLLGMVDQGLAEKYTAIMERRQEIAQMKTLAAAEAAAAEQKGVSAADKKIHEETKVKAESQAAAADEKISPLQKELVGGAKKAAGKAPADVREKVGPALVNLRQAVDDAAISNGAAAVRYPLAIPTLLSSAEAMVPVIVSDVIEEQTGKRPQTQGLKPGVTMDGGKVKVTLNGLDGSDMGKISIDQLTLETADRMQKWVTHALGLLGSISATDDTISFERDVLDALLDGFKASGWTAPAAATIPAAKTSNPPQ